MRRGKWPVGGSNFPKVFRAGESDTRPDRTAPVATIIEKLLSFSNRPRAILNNRAGLLGKAVSFIATSIRAVA